MSRVYLVGKLAARDVSRHLAQAALLVLAIGAATATLTMALALSGVTNQPYNQTRAATKGPDVVVYTANPSQAKPYLHARGVIASSGPFPIASTVLKFRGLTAAAEAEGRSTRAEVAVDQPDVTTGSWVHAGGVVVERTFAESLGVKVGDTLTLNTQRFTVVGIAVTAAQPPYPNLCYFAANDCGDLQFPSNIGPRNIGLVWTTGPDAVGLSSPSNPLDDYALNLQLADPSSANNFALANSPGGHLIQASGGHHRDLRPAPGPRAINPGQLPALFSTWEGLAQTDGLLVADAQSVLAPGAVLLALLAIASVAVLVGRRLSEFTRRVGLLKAVGATPALVAAAFLVENLVLALASAALGLVIGWLVAPALTNPGAALIGTPGAPSITLRNVILVLGVAIVVALAATLVPAIRAARSSTVRALADAARPPRRRATLIRLSRRLPLPMLFGLRLVARRPRRALLNAANMMVTAAGVVAVVCFQATVSAKVSGAAAAGLTGTGLSDPVVNRDEQMLAVITVMLVALAALNALFTTWAMVIDAKRASAVMRAFGARVRQVSAGMAIAQVASALPGVVVGTGLGFALFRAAMKGSAAAAPMGWIVLSAAAMLAAIGFLTFVPARVGARESVAEVLQSELA